MVARAGNRLAEAKAKRRLAGGDDAAARTCCAVPGFLQEDS